MKRVKLVVSSSVLAGLLSSFMAGAHAGEFLKCETQSDPQRSKISVGTEDLTPGALYVATVRSGGKNRRAMLAADPLGQVEFDFDSNRADIADGATRIPANFIKTEVRAVVTDALGNRVNAGSAVCDVK